MTSYIRPIFFLFAIILLLVQDEARAQFSDDFTDLDFGSNPAWTGDVARFIVNADTVLQLNDTDAGTSYLSTAFGTAYSLDNAEWQFNIRQAFAGSSSNFGRVYLASDQSTLTGVLNGYYLQFGEALSTDAIELFRQDGGSSVSVCRGTDGLIANGINMRIRVRRDASGNWDVSIDPAGGTSFAPHASGTDATYTSTTNFGVLCTYTSSNATKYYYDNFYLGPYIVDLTAPEVVSVQAISANAVDVRFSEPVEINSAQNLANYAVNNGINGPSSAVLDGGDATLVHLVFAGIFANGVIHEITISNVLDLANNALVTVARPFQYVVTEAANYRDIVINEFMADEDPSQGLPLTEYVEVFNASTKFIDLTGWKLSDNSSSGTVGALVLGPGEFAVLVPTGGVELFPFTQRVVGVTSWASPNNTGDDLVLSDTGDVLIDRLAYTTDWYGDPDKEDGGFSIEQINPYRSCTVASNWKASNDPNGGTPGAVNSLFDTTPDVTGPFVTGIQIMDSSRVVLLISEPISEASINPSLITVSPTAIVQSAVGVLPDLMQVELIFTAPLDTAIEYTIGISGLADCEGNAQAGNGSAVFTIPYDLRLGDVIINEVLADPFTGGRDFVELYNRSDRPVNLKNAMLANFSDDTISDLRIITELNYALPPQGYVCLTQDTTNIAITYINHGIGNLLQMESFPSYNIDSGTVFLLGMDSLVLERFAYNEDMHFSLLTDSKGFSLERLDPDRDVNDWGNWHSAAQKAGGGTPGLKNSQFFLTGVAQGTVSSHPPIFSPDDDAENETLNINYRFTELDLVGTVRIFDANGREVRLLAANQLLGTEGVFTWDGTMDDGRKARIGAYIILFETFEPGGTTQTYKLTTVLGGRL